MGTVEFVVGKLQGNRSKYQIVVKNFMHCVSDNRKISGIVAI